MTKKSQVQNNIILCSTLGCNKPCNQVAFICYMLVLVITACLRCNIFLHVKQVVQKSFFVKLVCCLSFIGGFFPRSESIANVPFGLIHMD